MTQFEQAVQDVKDGKIVPPSVSMGDKTIEYFKFQLLNHRFALKIMSSGMKVRGTNFTQVKKYYGLKARNAKDAVPEFQTLMDNFLNQ